MMRCNAAVLGLGLMLLICGCSQTYFLSKTDYDEFHRRLDLPRNLEYDPSVDAPPPADSREPATVKDPEREPRYLSLQEAIAIALQNGTVGGQSTRAPGLAGEDLVGAQGSTGGPFNFFGADSIRVLALQPALDATNIDRNLARYDTQWSTGMSWTTTDEPTQGLSSFQNGQAASFSSTLAKPLATGGVAGITFGTDYRIFATPPLGAFSVLSPSYTTRLQLGFEQPLLRGAGVEINQILGAHPGSNQFPALGRRVGTGEGILIARLRFDERRADFERTVNFMLLNVETAYWNLYGAYVNLFSAEQGMRMAYESWRVAKARLEQGVKDSPTLYPAAWAQYEQFRGNRLQALGSVLEAERNLRLLLGLPVEDGKRLVPADTPTLAPVQPNWQLALEDALNRRPELILVRQEVRARQLNLIAQRNALLPDLRLQASYTTVGLGSRLDGNGNFFEAGGTARTNNALRALASNHFNDWTVGLTLNVPLGYRFENATLRQARLGLAQAYFALKEQELKAENYLARQYRQVLESYKVIEARRQERQQAAERLRVIRNLVEGGRRAAGEVEELDALRQWAASLSSEAQAVVDYNNALVALEFAKGSIQQYDNVTISEGPLPQCAQVRAVDHERERTQALVLRERAVGVRHLLPANGSAAGLLQLPGDDAPSLPALLEGARLTRDQPERMGAAPALARVGQPVISPAEVAATPPGPATLPPAAVQAPAVPAQLGAPTNHEPVLPLRPALQ
ncbi:MAG: TolC family protein [Gemmataceae bacterium]|nr:TolC family protein [Gemmataceae bacterium]